jgi:hypothetical protein
MKWIFPISSTLEIVHIANQSILGIARKSDEKEELSLKLTARPEARSMGTTSFSRAEKT